MEIKIPREVRGYTEQIAMGLNFRQFICSIFAIGISVASYFTLKDYLGTEGVTWICIFVAFPLACLGFVKYHGMNLEAFLWAYLKSEWLMPNELIFKADNYMYISYEKLKIIKSKQCKRKRVK